MTGSPEGVRTCVFTTRSEVEGRAVSEELPEDESVFCFETVAFTFM